MLETISLILLMVLFIVYFAVRYYYNYWKRKSTPFIEVNIVHLDWYRMSLFDNFKKIYNQLSGHKFGGCFFCFSPRLVIRDLELINNVLIKDFDFFHDRGDVFFDENEPITMHMFGAPRPLWKNLRTWLTPTFTSGKMKHMFNLMQECAKELVDVIENDTKTENVIDVKDYCTRYTIEVISSCAFGLKTNSIKNRNSIFKVMVHQVFARTISRRIILWTKSICPSVKRILRLKLINKSVTEFFNKLTEDNVNHRRTNGINRHDFLQLLIKMQDNEKQQELKGQIHNLRITNEFITTQCFLFFIGGLETSSTTLILSLYEVAANRQIQMKLQNEMEAYLKKYDGQVTYEMMKNMPYLHQVVSETMRKYPVLATLSRVCTQNYQIPNSDTIIEKGTVVVIPISGLHRDPEYFPNPEKFDPDRFEEGNNSVNCHAYLPFGDGPRNCIGSRFGLMTVKLGLIHLLCNYNFELSPKTKYPFEFTPLKVVTSINHEMLLKCNKK